MHLYLGLLCINVIIIKWRTLFLVIFFVLKSTVSDFNIATAAFSCFYFTLCRFFPSFNLPLVCTFIFKIHLNTHFNLAFLKIQCTYLWLLMRVFRPFTFNVIIAILGFISVLAFVFFLVPLLLVPLFFPFLSFLGWVLFSYAVLFLYCLLSYNS